MDRQQRKELEQQSRQLVEKDKHAFAAVMARLALRAMVYVQTSAFRNHKDGLVVQLNLFRATAGAIRLADPNLNLNRKDFDKVIAAGNAAVYNAFIAFDYDYDYNYNAYADDDDYYDYFDYYDAYAAAGNAAHVAAAVFEDDVDESFAFDEAFAAYAAADNFGTIARRDGYRGKFFSEDLEGAGSIGGSALLQTPLFDGQQLVSFTQQQKYYYASLCGTDPSLKLLADAYARWTQPNPNFDDKFITALIDLPKELHDNPKGAMDWLQKELQGLERNRVVILGPGGAGKTSLWHRLLGKDKPGQAATRGVGKELLPNDSKLHNWENLFGGTGGKKKAAELNKRQIALWDFGGQSIQLNAHQMFISDNLVYLLVLDSRSESEPDDWIAQAMAWAGNNFKKRILVVTNQQEGVHFRQNHRELERRFGLSKKQFFYFSCVQPKGDLNTAQEKKEYRRFQKALGIALLDAGIKHTIQIVGAVEWIEAQAADGAVCLEKEALLKGGKIEESDLLTLKRLGVLSYASEKKTRRLLFDSAFLVQTLYQVLLSKRLQQGDGCIKHDDLEEELLSLQKCDEHVCALLIEYMIKTHLCFQEGEDCYVFPDAAGFEHPPVLETLLNAQSSELQDEQSEIQTIEYMLRCAVFSRGLPLQLYTQIHREAAKEDKLHWWRNGVVWCDSNDQPKLAVVVERGRKAIRFLAPANQQQKIEALLEFAKTQLCKDVLLEPMENEAFIDYFQGGSHLESKPVATHIDNRKTVNFYGAINEVNQINAETYIENFHQAESPITKELLQALQQQADSNSELQKLLGELITAKEKGTPLKPKQKNLLERLALGLGMFSGVRSVGDAINETLVTHPEVVLALVTLLQAGF